MIILPYFYPLEIRLWHFSTPDVIILLPQLGYKCLVPEISDHCMKYRLELK
jgi:hypothetical protein